MKARTLCCNRLMDVKKAVVAKTRFGEFLVCNEDCRKFVEKASERQIRNLMVD